MISYDFLERSQTDFPLGAKVSQPASAARPRVFYVEPGPHDRRGGGSDYAAISQSNLGEREKVKVFTHRDAELMVASAIDGMKHA